MSGKRAGPAEQQATESSSPFLPTATSCRQQLTSSLEPSSPEEERRLATASRPDASRPLLASVAAQRPSKTRLCASEPTAVAIVSDVPSPC